jgi:hypothetical protein
MKVQSPNPPPLPPPPPLNIQRRKHSGITCFSQAVKTCQVVCNNPKLSSAVSDSQRRLAITAHAAYSAAADACFTVQTQQTGGVF